LFLTIFIGASALESEIHHAGSIRRVRRHAWPCLHWIIVTHGPTCRSNGLAGALFDAVGLYGTWLVYKENSYTSARVEIAERKASLPACRTQSSGI